MVLYKQAAFFPAGYAGGAVFHMEAADINPFDVMPG